MASGGSGGSGAGSGSEASYTHNELGHNFNCNNSGAESNNRLDGNDENLSTATTTTTTATTAFHPRCSRRITLSNSNRTAVRSLRDFSSALVFSAEPLVNDVLFEVIIEHKNDAWGGSIEIGATQQSPSQFDVHASTTAMPHGTWIVSGTEVRYNGECIIELNRLNLETMSQGDRLGIMRTHKDELVFFVNGGALAAPLAYGVPQTVWGLVNLHGRGVQVSVSPNEIDNCTAAIGSSSSNSKDLNAVIQQQLSQSLNMPLSVDISVVASTNALNSSLADASSPTPPPPLPPASTLSTSLTRTNALMAARRLCASRPSPSLFSTTTCQQSNNNANNNNSLSAISSAVAQNSSVVVAAAAGGDFYDMNEPMRFHIRCGSLVKLSTNFRSAERRRPLDEFNNGVVMTHRPLKDNELFEIRIDKLVDKWSGSIEVGVTTHNPTVLHFPATMTNMRSGTIMMSGCGILTNGKGTRRQYGEFNLDELAEGDRVGMMRKSNGNLHYYINGQDQGVAATRVASTLWGVIDLYGMTTKVTIVDRDEREQQNLVTRRNNMLLTAAAAAAANSACSATSSSVAAAAAVAATATVAAVTSAASALAQMSLNSSTPLLSLHSPDSDLQQLTGANGISSGDAFANGSGIAGCTMNGSTMSRNEDRLTFNPHCGQHAQVTHSGRTALRPNASDDFNNGVVLTRRPLRPNELFQVRLERVVSKWAGSVEMGVTIYSAEELDFPFTMTNVRTGTWMMTGNGVMQNGITVIEQYGQNLDRLQVGDRVGVMRKDDGSLHFFVNGVDQGLAVTGVPERVYGVIDLYGQAAQASIVDSSECGSPDTGNSTISNTTLYSEPPLRFHTIHGKNAVISNGGVTASRPNSLAEFNDSIVFSNRPLRQRELFEVVLENMVRHWSGNIEIGVTGTRPEDLTLSPNATDLEGGETIILCGSMLFRNKKTIRSNLLLDLDSLSANTRVGVMRSGDFIHFYINGIDQGPACECCSPNIWAIVDLYGQCAQVSLTSQAAQAADTPRVAPYATSENSQSCQATSVIQPATMEAKHRWTCVSGMVQLSQNWTVASRLSGTTAALTRCLVFSESPLRLGSPFEIRILVRNPMLAGSLSIGITDLNLIDDYVRRNLPVNIKRIPANVWYLSGNELRHNMRVVQRSATSLEWLRTGDRISLELTTGRTLRVLFNSEDMNIHFKHVAMHPYVVVELHGSTMAIQAISSQVPMSPLRPCILRLQDSMDFGIDPLNRQDSMLESIESEAINFEFMERHGANVKLQTECRTAKRTASFNNGLIFGNKPMSKGETISIRIDRVNTKWQGTIGVGVVGFYPANVERVPPTILHITRRCWGITSDYININGQRIPSNNGELLNCIQAGTIITLSLNFANMLIITVGNQTLEELGTIPSVVYPVFDLYGKCEQITALTMPANEIALNGLNANSPPLATSKTGTASAHTLENTGQLMVGSGIATNSTTAQTSANSMAAMTVSTAIRNGILTVTESGSSLNHQHQHNHQFDIDADVDTDADNHLSREKADLERHEKETNDSIEAIQQQQPTTSIETQCNHQQQQAQHTTSTTAPKQCLNESICSDSGASGNAAAGGSVEHNEHQMLDNNEADDDDENDPLLALHSSPGCTNLALELNRFVMESVSENLLTNMSIQIRSLEQQTRQSGLNAATSNSLACCLRESLQLQHNTNLNIQRSQSTQRFQQQQQLQNQQLQQHNQQQQPPQNTLDTNKTSNDDSNEDLDGVLENAATSAAPTSAITALTTLPNDFSASNNATATTATTGAAVAAAGRNWLPANAFRNFIANELGNDSSSNSGNCSGNSSTTNITSCSGSGGNSNSNNRCTINEENAAARRIFEAALNECSSSSSSNSPRGTAIGSGGAGATANAIASVSSLSTARSTSSNDSGGGTSLHAAGPPVRLLMNGNQQQQPQRRIVGGQRQNDFFLDNISSSSSLGSRSFDEVNLATKDYGRSNHNNNYNNAAATAADDGVQILMAPNPNWRSSSPINVTANSSSDETQNCADAGAVPDAASNHYESDDDEQSSQQQGWHNTRVDQRLHALRTTGAANGAAAGVTSTVPTRQDNSLSSLERRDCNYLKLVQQFFASLVLPQVFFTRTSDAICYCIDCCPNQQSKLKGWVYWPLNQKVANAHEPPALLMESDQYLCMYFITRVDQIRAILDYGQLVPQDSSSAAAGEERDNEPHTPTSTSSGQKDEPGTRLELHFTTDTQQAMAKNTHLNFTHNGRKYKIGAAFEVYVRDQALCNQQQQQSAINSNSGSKHNLRNKDSNVSMGMGAVGGHGGSGDRTARSSSSALAANPSASSSSLSELSCFTKEDGACFINALVLRLEELFMNDDDLSSIEGNTLMTTTTMTTTAGRTNSSTSADSNNHFNLV